MRGTALLYSSHNRGDVIHNDYIVQRALRGRNNKRILFLPMSETVENGNELSRQEFSYGGFEWYFRFFDRYGLEYFPFYWRSSLRKEDVDQLWHHLWSSEVVILGGGHSRTGLARYKELGARFDGEWGKFGRILHERQARGLLTVGFSAGADQLAEYTFGRALGAGGDTDGFGLARNVICTLHHDGGRNDDLRAGARRLGHCLAFGLPNDAGIYVDQGVLPSGNHWQVIEFVIDKSWTNPRDYWHVKTRSGALIEHFYADGRHWAFQGGDRLVRVQSPDNRFQAAWVLSHGRMMNYYTQRPDHFLSIEGVLSQH
jgi:hypothetical protein